MQEKYGFVYIWRDRKHKRYYVGSHWGTEDDGYVCSSNWMRKSYKRRSQDFRRRIIVRVFTNRKDLLKEESRWLGMIQLSELGNRYYNHTRSAGGRENGYTHSDETCKIISEATKNKTWSEERKKAWSESLTGKSHGTPDENGRKYKERSDIGKERKPYKKGNQYSPLKGKKWHLTPEQNAAKTLRQLGRKHPHSEEAKLKISMGMKKYREEMRGK